MVNIMSLFSGVCIKESQALNKTCMTDMDCDNGTSCVDGMCTVLDQCVSKQCQQEELCKEVTCVRDNNNSFIPCTQDEDCSDGIACSSLDICVDPFHPLHKCNEEVSCGSNGMCQNETCAPLPGPGKSFETTGIQSQCKLLILF